MKKTLFFLSFLVSALSLTAQQQISIGTPATTEVFNDVKDDPNAGGTVHVGSVGVAGVGNGTDIYMVRLNANRQIVWERTIQNPGNDVLYKVRICANGDYIAAGRYFQIGQGNNGQGRGFVCRINPAGNLLWSTTTLPLNSANGDVFYDLIEMANGNIAVAGTQNLIPNGANGMVVIYNANGAEITKGVSNFNNSDEFQTINQIPNGTLVVCGHFWTGTSYEAMILEFNAATLAITFQSNHRINLNVPGVNPAINTFWPAHGYVVGNSIVYNIAGVTGPGNGNSIQFVYNYTPGTGITGGRYFYHNNTAGNFTMFPLGANDHIITQSDAAIPGNVYVSRVTNGITVYDRQVGNTTTNSILGVDVTGTNLFLTGSTPPSASDAYSLFGNINFPVSTNPCLINNSNTLQNVPNMPLAGGATVFAFTNTLPPSALINIPSVGLANVVTNICGVCPPDITINVTKCNIEDITLTARPGTTYSWSPGTALSSTTIQNPVCSATSSITYTVTITNTVTNCTYLDIFNVTVENCHCEDSCNWSLTGNSNVLNRNFIGSINNADFKIRTNNTQRMVVSSSGNVGINIPTPAKLLDVNGEVRVRNLPASAVNDGVVLANNSGDLRTLLATGNTNHYLSGNGTWQILPAGGNITADQGLTMNGNTVLLGDVCNVGGGKFIQSREVNMDDKNLYFNSSRSGKLFMGLTSDGSTDVCRELFTRLEISSLGLNANNDYSSPGPSTSGLRFTDLTSDNSVIANETGGVLSLDKDGDVIWVKACCSGVLDPEQLKDILDRLTKLENEVKQSKAEAAALKDQIAKMDVILANSNMIILNQNTPNPFAEHTTITYSIPKSFSKAQIIFTAVTGEVIKIADIKTSGKGLINVYANDLTSGIYFYTLWVDGKQIESKRMLKQK